MKSKFICCYLEENYGMSIYDSKEELLENLGDVFEVETFEELIVQVQVRTLPSPPKRDTTNNQKFVHDIRITTQHMPYYVDKESYY